MLRVNPPSHVRSTPVASSTSNQGKCKDCSDQAQQPHPPLFFPETSTWSSAGKESACNAGDPGSNPGSGTSPGEGIGYSFQYSWASTVVQLVKESACNAGDPGSIPGLGRSPGEGIGYPLQCSWASLMAQLVKTAPAMWEAWVRSLV